MPGQLLFTAMLDLNNRHVVTFLIFHSLHSICVFHSDPSSEMATLASSLLNIFRLLLHNQWTDFDETWQEASLQRPLPILWFSCRSVIQDGRPGLWLTETLLLLNHWTDFVETWQWWARKPVNHTSWVALVTPTDRPKSVRNRCLIELFCGVVCVVTLPFWHFCWCRGFCHRTESDLFLFLLTGSKSSTSYTKFLFCGDWSSKMATLASDWLKYTLHLCN